MGASNAFDLLMSEAPLATMPLSRIGPNIVLHMVQCVSMYCLLILQGSNTPLQLEGTLHGPLALALDIHQIGYESPDMYMYKASFDTIPLDHAGYYQMQLYVSFTDVFGSFPKFPTDQPAALSIPAVDIHSEFPWTFIPGDQVHSQPKLECRTFSQASEGTWSRSPLGGNWEWYPTACNMASSAPNPKLCKRTLFVGDSHTRMWAQYLNHTASFGHKQWSFQFIKGLVAPKQLVEDEHRYWNRNITLDTVFKSLTHDVDLMVLNSGHWDLRDLSVSEFVADFQSTLPLLKAWVGTSTRQVLWRTILPFTYIHKSGDYSREYRTNPKIQQANYEIALLVEDYPYIQIYDSWAFAAPFWTKPCDTHHYLCGNFTRSTSWVGLQDIHTFLRMSCE